MFEMIHEELKRIAREYRKISFSACGNPLDYESFCVDATFEIDTLYPELDFSFSFDYIHSVIDEPPHFMLTVEDIREIITL